MNAEKRPAPLWQQRERQVAFSQQRNPRCQGLCPHLKTDRKNEIDNTK